MNSSNNKYNIEQLMELIPDYITGQISDSDKLMLEKAMNESAELKEMYNEMTGTLAFVVGAKLTEPAEQYWNSLLPRIHQKIEEKTSKGFSWANIPAIWKYIVPIAAVLLIALVYYLVKPSNVQITKDKEIENIKKDTNQDNIENKNNNDNKDNNKLPQNDNNGVVKEDQKHKSGTDTRKHHKPNRFNDNIVKQNALHDSDYTKPDEVNNDYTTVDDDETSVFSNGEGAGLDLETEDALKELTDTEQEQFLKQLEKSNL